MKKTYIFPLRLYFRARKPKIFNRLANQFPRNFANPRYTLKIHYLHIPSLYISRQTQPRSRRVRTGEKRRALAVLFGKVSVLARVVGYLPSSERAARTIEIDFSAFGPPLRLFFSLPFAGFSRLEAQSRKPEVDFTALLE